MIKPVQIQGMPELLRTLRTLDDKIQKKVLRRAVYAGAKVMKAEVVARAPVAPGPHKRGGRLVQPGTLKRAALHKWARELSDQHNQAYVVTFRRGKQYQSVGKRGIDKDAFYWPWVEYGHKIVPRKGKAGGTIRARRSASRAVVPPHPFFEPAYRSGQEPAERAMQGRLSELLDEVLNES